MAGICEVKCAGRRPGEEPLALAYMKPFKGESVVWQDHIFSTDVKISFSPRLLALLIYFHGMMRDDPEVDVGKKKFIYIYGVGRCRFNCWEVSGLGSCYSCFT